MRFSQFIGNRVVLFSIFSALRRIKCKSDTMSQWIWLNVTIFCKMTTAAATTLGRYYEFISLCRTLYKFCWMADDIETKIPRQDQDSKWGEREINPRKIKMNTNVKFIFDEDVSVAVVIEQLNDFEKHKTMVYLAFILHRDAQRADAWKWKLFGFRVKLWCGFAHKWIHLLYHWFR